MKNTLKEIDGLLKTLESQICGARRHFSLDRVLLADLKAREQTLMQVRVMLQREQAATRQPTAYQVSLLHGDEPCQTKAEVSRALEAVGLTAGCLVQAEQPEVGCYLVDLPLGEGVEFLSLQGRNGYRLEMES